MDRNETIFLRLQFEGNSETVNAVTDLRQGLAGARQEVKDLSREALNAEKSLMQLRDAGQANTDEYKQLETSLGQTQEQLKAAAFNERALREELKSTNRELNQSIRDFNKFGQAIPTDSIEGLARQYSQMRRELRLVPREIRDLSDEFDKNGRFADDISEAVQKTVLEYRKLRISARDTKQEIIDFDQGINDFTSNIGNYVSALGGFGGSLGTILGQIGSGLTGLGGGGGGALGIASGGGVSGALDAFGLGGLSQAARALGPAGTIVTTLAAGTAAIAGHVATVTLEYERLFNQVRLTNSELTGEEVREATALAKTIAEVYEQDFNRVIEEANALSRGFGVSYAESLRAIETGLLNLPTEAQDTFIDSLREYPQLIASAGFSLDEFIALQIRSADEGLFDDKLVDSLKEADIALKEFTQTQFDAIENLAGEAFAQDFQRRLADGTTTTRDAILEIGALVEQQGADFNDLGQITADIFKGAGEDAGGFETIYRVVVDSIQDATDGLEVPQDAFTQRLLQQRDATQELNEQQAILAAQFAGTGTSMEGLTTRAQALGTALLNDILLQFRAIADELTDDSIPIFDRARTGIVELINTASLGILGNGAEAIFGIDIGVRDETIEKIKQQDAEALAEVQAGLDAQAKADAEAKEAQAERDRQELARKRAQARATREINERLREQEREDAAEAKRLDREREAAEKEAARVQQQLDRDRLKASENIFKLEQALNEEFIDELNPEDLQAYITQVQILRNKAEQEIAGLVGDENQVRRQAELIQAVLEEQIDDLTRNRDQILALQGVERGVQSDTLDANRTFISATENETNPERIAEAERQLQIRLLEIEQQAILDRTELEILNEDERLERLNEAAQKEIEINALKNEKLIEDEQKVAEQRQEYLNAVNEANRQALEGIGNSIGEFLINVSEDSEAAFNQLGESILETLLDLVAQQITLLVTSSFAQPDSVASFGASGALRVSLITGLIQGAVQGLKGLILNSFETGGRIPKSFPGAAGGRIKGPDHTRGGVKFMTEDGFIGEAMGGEIILNPDQEQALKALFGDGVLGDIGVPGEPSSNGSRNTDAGNFIPQVSVPTYVVQSQSVEISDSSIDKFIEANVNGQMGVVSQIKDEVVKGLKESRKQEARGNRARDKAKKRNTL